MKKGSLLTLGLALMAASCAGNAEPESTAPAPDSGTMLAEAGNPEARVDGDAPMRERMRRRQGMQAGDSTGMAGRHGRMGKAEGAGHGGDRAGRGGMQRGGGGGQGGHMGMGRTVDRPDTPAELAEGQRLFDAVCSQCHSLDAPPNLAPPMSHVARHLSQAFDTEEAFRGHIRSFVRSPDAERSVMPPHAIERFGLMPALPLPEPLLDQISAYVWWIHQVDSEARSAGGT